MKKYGLIGNPLSHSFSKDFFSSKFSSEGIKAVYDNYELSSLTDFHLLFKQHNLSGLNVTIPYKEVIIPLLDDCDPLSRKIGAINTIVPEKVDGKWILKGYNTDVYGFSQSLKGLLKSHHQKALILGTGGASKAAAYVLGEYGLKVNFISRSKKVENAFLWSEINENMVAQHGIIINTTPIGMFPNTEQLVPFPYEFLNETHLVVDLIYNPKETLFLRTSKSFSVQTLNGEKMLINQALKSWEIWNKY